MLKNIELSQKSETMRRPTQKIADIRKDVIDSIFEFLIAPLQISNSDLLNTIDKIKNRISFSAVMIFAYFKHWYKRLLSFWVKQFRKALKNALNIKF